MEDQLKSIQNQNSKQWLVVLVVFLLVLIGIGWFLFGKNLQNQFSSPANQTQVKQTKTDPKAFQNQFQVMIANTGFSPQTVTVKKGVTITWINQTSKLHMVASDPHPSHTALPGFDSLIPLGPNDAYSFTFEKSGTFTYHDHLNPFKYRGTVVVE